MDNPASADMLLESPPERSLLVSISCILRAPAVSPDVWAGFKGLVGTGSAFALSSSGTTSDPVRQPIMSGTFGPESVKL